ncbi:MAG: type II toxin-antitoxin system prevent-host-death family antitoxin [Robiginitomaculum sp.]|nr:type II toxin-antitoxin system prevent-host-death family antitoxin [Robiginitomaculum sp.]
MKTYSSTDAKREFGDILLRSQRAPISVTRNGKPVAVIVSETEFQEMKLQALRAALIEGEQSGDAGVLDMVALRARAKQQAGLVG